MGPQANLARFMADDSDWRAFLNIALAYFTPEQLARAIAYLAGTCSDLLFTLITIYHMGLFLVSATLTHLAMRLLTPRATPVFLYTIQG
jgi:hypothetical protein